MAISRRTFLIRGAEVGVGVAAVGLVGARLVQRGNDDPVLYRKGAFPEPGHPKVAVVKQSSYGNGLEATVKGGLEAVGADVNGKTVLLKPNLVEYDAGTVINTDPRLVHATVLALRQMGAASVTVGRGAGPPPRHRVRRSHVRLARRRARRRRAVHRPEHGGRRPPDARLVLHTPR